VEVNLVESVLRANTEAKNEVDFEDELVEAEEKYLARPVELTRTLELVDSLTNNFNRHATETSIPHQAKEEFQLLFGKILSRYTPSTTGDRCKIIRSLLTLPSLTDCLRSEYKGAKKLKRMKNRMATMAANPNTREQYEANQGLELKEAEHPPSGQEQQKRKLASRHIRAGNIAKAAQAILNGRHVRPNQQVMQKVDKLLKQRKNPERCIPPHPSEKTLQQS
jgi:hypothetical protein